MSDLITTHGFPQAPVWSEHRRGLTAADSFPVELPRTAGVMASGSRWASVRVRLIVGDPAATTATFRVCCWDETVAFGKEEEGKWTVANDVSIVSFSTLSGKPLPGMFRFESLGRLFLVVVVGLTALREVDIDVAGAGRVPGYA